MIFPTAADDIIHASKPKTEMVKKIGWGNLNSIEGRGRDGQGAIEYKLILAVVLFVIAAGVGFLTAIRPSALSVTGTASKSGDNILFTPSISMIPPTIPADNWKYAIYRGATKVYPVDTDWAPGTVTLERSIPVQLVATGNQIGDTLKIKYKGYAFDTRIGE